MTYCNYPRPLSLDLDYTLKCEEPGYRYGCIKTIATLRDVIGMWRCRGGPLVRSGRRRVSGDAG